MIEKKYVNRQFAEIPIYSGYDASALKLINAIKTAEEAGLKNFTTKLDIRRSVFSVSQYSYAILLRGERLETDEEALKREELLKNKLESAKKELADKRHKLAELKKTLGLTNV